MDGRNTALPDEERSDQRTIEEVDVPEGAEFDPRLHHAVATYRDPSVAVDTVTKVQRRGYNFKGQSLRSPEVVVAQPADDTEEA